MIDIYIYIYVYVKNKGKLSFLLVFDAFLVPMLSHVLFTNQCTTQVEILLIEHISIIWWRLFQVWRLSDIPVFPKSKIRSGYSASEYRRTIKY